MTRARNLSQAPDWNQLPGHVQNDFNNAGFGNWYQEANNTARLTLINNYVKMREADLWQYVNGPASPPHETQSGALDFLTRDIDGFRSNLYGRNDFSDPTPLPILDSDKKLASREYASELSLHFKTFQDWPENRIQVHIDQYGLVPSQGRIDQLWNSGVSEFGAGIGREVFDQLGKHLGSYNSYQDVHHISEQLQNRGFDLDIPFGRP